MKKEQRYFSPEEKIKKVNEVKELVKSGLQLKDAVKQAGISSASFSRWTSQHAPAKVIHYSGADTKPIQNMTALKVKANGQIAIVIGSPSQILEFYRGL